MSVVHKAVVWQFGQPVILSLGCFAILSITDALNSMECCALGCV
jgi:hypothetical protein